MRNDDSTNEIELPVEEQAESNFLPMVRNIFFGLTLIQVPTRTSGPKGPPGNDWSNRAKGDTGDTETQEPQGPLVPKVQEDYGDTGEHRSKPAQRGYW